MKDRHPSWSYFVESLNKHEENYNLVVRFFADQGFPNPKISSTKVAINSAVAVLDIPKSDLLLRAEYIDKSNRISGIPRLTDFYYERFSHQKKNTSDEAKAKTIATRDLAIEMAARITVGRLKNLGYDRDLTSYLLDASKDAVRIFF